MEEITHKRIVLFDGVCNLCNGAVRFIIRHDAKDQFRFASLQSDFAKQLLKKHHFPIHKTGSIILIEGGKVYLRSGAVLGIIRRLGGFWKLLVVFYIIPRFIRDGMYDFIARNRYKWFGKRNECMIPTKELRQRFLA